jgi:hypothetical protein
MKKSLILAVLSFAATASLSAASYSISVTINSTMDANVIPTGTYQGSFVTTDTCTLCTVQNNGGITSLDVPIPTGPGVTTPAVLVFDGIESATLAQYDTGTQTLSGNINMLQTLTATTDPTFPSGTLVFLGMTPTTLNASPVCDSNGIGSGCVIVNSTEGSIAVGTYTITAQPAAGGCPATIGFWKHHPFPNTVQQSGMTIGGVLYTASDLLKILNNNGGNAVVILGRQLVGALMNLAAAGVHNSSADSAIMTAQSLLQTNNLNLLTSNVSPSSQLGQSLVTPSAVLDKYNNADFNTCREGSGLVTGSK